MILQFFLKYRTRFGQKVVLFSPDLPAADGKIEMSYHDSESWSVTVDTGNKIPKKINYHYAIEDNDGTTILDGEEDRVLQLSKKDQQSNLTIIDLWNDPGDPQNIYYTSALRTVFPTAKGVKKLVLPSNITHEFRVKAPSLQADETLCILGSSPSLKSWDTSVPVVMLKEGDWYVAGIRIEEDEWPASYKYAIYNKKEKKFVAYEEGENRPVPLQSKNPGRIILHDGFVRIRFNGFRGAGVNIPVFSLRSKKSFGTGEFSDLKYLIDWAYETGIKMIQLLPVNDTSAHFNKADSYPYAAVSSFALHPLYINLEKVASKENAGIIKALKKKQKQLNELPQVDYEEVMQFKMYALRELFDLQKDTLKEDTVFNDFVEQNQHWLMPYAAYSTLKKKYNTPDFNTWQTHSVYDAVSVKRMGNPGRPLYNEILFYYFIQYHLHLQLDEVSKYARKKKIILKGDIPIGIYRYSCDAWVDPSLYNMDEQAGAPPDDFAVKGQNWGFPTYNWRRMQKDGFEWWRRRFERMSNYFDAFRIDHILGFFRIWSIPLESTEGIMGRFVPALPVQLSEFEQHNIPFDYKRFCSPYITDAELESVFGEHAETAKERFFKKNEKTGYTFLSEWNTQRKVIEGLSENDKPLFRSGLLDLLSNVILFEERKETDNAYHFRFGMDKTSSYEKMEQQVKDNLFNLYIDYFYHRQETLWQKEAMAKLPSLKRSTNMLVCGEDLGMVPQCVPEVMKQLGILSLEVERMPKKSGKEFAHPNEAGYLSIVTPSTHDMSTIREWWTEDKEKSQKFYNEILGHFGPAPAECTTSVAKEIISQHLYSPAIWSVFLLQDLFAMNKKLSDHDPREERINIPADPNHYWRYRMPVFLEDLLKETEYNSELKKIITNSGR
ncbi:MAG: 4-alpha-glucanotransferase [Chitinophagaceae bacterium]|nr:4-alpha-glucanotransferase [Chitinophagaceae bacterium]